MIEVPGGSDRPEFRFAPSSERVAGFFFAGNACGVGGKVLIWLGDGSFVKGKLGVSHQSWNLWTTDGSRKMRVGSMHSTLGCPPKPERFQRFKCWPKKKNTDS